MKNRGWDHSALTSKQREFFDALATSNNPNTMAAHSEIAKEALIAGGASKQEAADLIKKSLDNLNSQGVTSPTRIPWN